MFFAISLLINCYNNLIAKKRETINVKKFKLEENDLFVLNKFEKRILLQKYSFLFDLT